jgi:SPP1 gp7 family putative phage head morphogenesis protein
MDALESATAARPPPREEYDLPEKKDVNVKILDGILRYRYHLVGVENSAVRAILRGFADVFNFVQVLFDEKNPELLRRLSDARLIPSVIIIKEASEAAVPYNSKTILEIRNGGKSPLSPTGVKSVVDYLIGTVDAHVNSMNDIAARIIQQTVLAVVEMEPKILAGIIKQAFPKPVIDSGLAEAVVVNDDPPLDRMTNIVIGGTKYADAMKRRYGKALKKIEMKLTNGLLQGQGIRLISKEIRNILNKELASGAAMLARTEIQRAAARAGKELYAHNRDIIKEEVWVATLDIRICILCGTLDGQRFPVGKGPQPVEDTHPGCRCILDPRTKIYTSKGWKYIRDIEVGNLVLTHRGRFKPVIDVHEPAPYKDTAIRISFRKGRKINSILVTKDHPFKTSGGWVNAESLSKTMSIGVATKKCAGCDSSVLLIGDQDYCSQKCAMRTIVVSDSYRKSMSVAKKKEWRNPAYRKRILEMRNSSEAKTKTSVASKRMWQDEGFRHRRKLWLKETVYERSQSTTDQWQNPTIRNRMSKAISRGNILSFQNGNRDRYESTEKARAAVIRKYGSLSKLFSDEVRHLGIKSSKRKTWIEKRMGWLLNQIGLDCDYNSPILLGFRESNGKPRYVYPDYSIPGTRILIECDGEYWHKKVRKDAVRQLHLENLGYTVLRFSGRDIKHDLAGCGLEVLRVLSNHKREYGIVYSRIHSIERVEVGVQDRLGRMVKACRKRYNFAVEGDESYVAKGFVVHNCLRSPVTKSWKELGIDIDEAPPGARASMSGAVPGRVTFVDWFKRQPDKVKREILGKGRFDLYKAGDLDFKQFATNKRILTLKQLRRKYNV